MNVVAHQPYLLPWLGLIQKIAACDAFVVLDDVQFAKRNFQNRVGIKTPQGHAWLTVPVVTKGRYEQRIRDVVIADDADPADFLATVRHAYGRARHFAEVWDPLSEIVGDLLRPGRPLADLNVALLAWLLDCFACHPDWYFQSDLETSGHKNDLMISVTEAVGGDCYLCGIKAALEYMDPAAWRARGLAVKVVEFPHQPYPQLWGEFVTGLSALDLLANVGVEAARAYLPRGPARPLPLRV